MPRYQVTAPDGRTVVLEGDTPPTDADLDGIFGSLPPKAAAPSSPPELSMWEKIQQASTGALSGVLSGLESTPMPGGGVPAIRPDVAPPIPDTPAPSFPPTSPAEGLGRAAGRTVLPGLVAAASGGLSLPLQGAVQGALGAATEGPVGGVLGAAAPFVGPAISKALGPVGRGLKGMAVKQFERGLGATKEAMKTEAARIAPELVERGVSGGLKGLSKRATTQVEDIGKQIQVAYQTASKAGTKVDGGQLANALERLKVPFKEVGQSGEEVVLNPKAVGAIEDLQGILRELGESSPSAIWKFRKTVDDVVSASNGFTRELPGGTARQIQKETRAILQRELNKAVPDVAALNSEFRLWKGLQDVTAATLKRRTSQERNLIPAILGSGVGGGLAATGSLTGAGAGGLATAALVQLVRSPLWRTTSAITKNQLANILAGDAQALSTEAGRNAITLLALFGSKGAGRPEPTLAGTGP